jgi:hypothetical protein
MILCILMPFKKFKVWPCTWLVEFRGWMLEVEVSNWGSKQMDIKGIGLDKKQHSATLKIKAAWSYHITTQCYSPRTT